MCTFGRYILILTDTYRYIQIQQIQQIHTDTYRYSNNFFGQICTVLSVCIGDVSCMYRDRYIQIHTDTYRYRDTYTLNVCIVCICMYHLPYLVHIMCISYVSVCIFCSKIASRANTYNTYRYIQICTRYAQDTCKIHTKYMQIHAQNLRDAAVHICMYCMYHVCIMYVFWGECISYVSVCICMYLYVLFTWILAEPALLHHGMYLYVSVCICMFLYVSKFICMYFSGSLPHHGMYHYVSVCISMYLYKCMYFNVSICIYMYCMYHVFCMYLYVSVYTACICMYFLLRVI